MYKILTVEDKIKVPPSKFGLGLEDAVISSLEDKLEGVIDRRFGIILAITGVGDVGEGKIFPGDGSIHYPVSFDMLVYSPEVNEMTRGTVIDVTEFGVFIRIGPLDGMIHVSQIMDDFVSYDNKNNVFSGRESKRFIKEKDEVRARIVSISLGKDYKIGLTTRQPGLGVIDWKDARKDKKSAKAEKPEKKGKK